MFKVPSNTIPLRPDSVGPGRSDASISDSVCTPSNSDDDNDDANDATSLARVKAMLKKRDELQREYQKARAARRSEGTSPPADPPIDLRSHVQREGRRTKHKWSSVKVTPSEYSVDEQVQVQASIATPPALHKAKNRTEILRDK
ncbi:hypothetical protein N0V95_007231 [Ascochyta clinopodiicola]|nr:hypothetical protein N0V95_007231 [Ascochyta clinopodiicola]